MVSLIQLEYIIALDTYKSFSVAADKCFVTQPTLSMQVKKMENDLGIIIFDRTAQPIESTKIGREIIDQARIILSESKKIQEIIQANNNTLKGELRIGIIPSLAPYLLPLFIGSFAKKNPDIKVIVKEFLSEEIAENLKKEIIDIGILVTPLLEKDLNEQPVFYEKILVYCNENHPFAKLEEISIQQIANEKIWLLTHGHCFRNQVINLCKMKKQGNNLPFTYESASIETLIKLTDIEGGLTLIPELALTDLTSAKKKQAKTIKNLSPIREVSLVTSKVFIKKRMQELLLEEILSSLPSEYTSKKRGKIVEWQ